MLRALVLAIAFICAASAPAQAKRVALVIGESAYRTITPLANPGNDARLVANALAQAGFDVQLGTDLDRRGLETALQEFALDAAQADVAVVYYAGHGLEADGQNWLAPVDANIQSLDDVAGAAVPFDHVARSLAGAKVKIVAMDACRDNPFAARLRAPTGTINRGLAEVELDGYVVMYAAAAGAVALDGAANSPFATTFAHWVGVQNVDLRLLAGKIRDDVIASTAGAQRPFISASLPGEAVLLAPASAGRVRGAATVRTRAPRAFDFVRTLRDPACVQTRTVTCQTENMVVADGRLVTIEDDARLRVWDAGRGTVTRALPAPSSQYSDRHLLYSSDLAALAITLGSDVDVIPLAGGAVASREIEHYNNPEFLFAAGATVVYQYKTACGLGFVDLRTLERAGNLSWAPACIEGEARWGFEDPGSDRFVAQVAAENRSEPYTTREILIGSYRAHTILCRIAGAANDAAFGADGDLYVARDDGAVTRYDHGCKAKQSYHMHQAAIEQLGALTGGRLISRSVDGVMKIWSPATSRVEHELTGLAREARVVDYSADGAVVLILNEDKRLYLWYGDARLDPYVGPTGPVCAGALSPDRNTLYAAKCEGNVEVWRRQTLN